MHNFNFKTKNIKIENDTVYAKVDKLNFADKSGFILNNLKGNFKVTDGTLILSDAVILTPHSSLKGYVSLSGPSFADYSDFVNNVDVRIDLIESTVNFKDLSYFVPSLLGMNDKVQFSGNLKGKVNNFKGKNLEIKYGNNTKFLGNITMVGLPNFEETFVNLFVNNFSSSAVDIESFSLPSTDGKPFFITLPKEIKKIENIKFNGAFTGFINNFVAKAQFYTNLGGINTDINCKKINTDRKFSYSGNIAAISFNMGALLPPNTNLGKVSFKLNIAGEGINSSNIKTTLNGKIDSLGFMGYFYKNIVLSANIEQKIFNAILSIKDPNINLNFKGLVDYSDTLPRFDFEAKLDNLHLARLNLWKRDSMTSLSAKLDIEFKGDNIDNMQGNIQVDSLLYTEGTKNLKINNIILTVNSDENNNKKLKFISDITDADISGNFKFTDMPVSIEKFLEDYIPSFVNSNKTKQTFDIPAENFTYNIVLKDISPLCNIFFPVLNVASNSVLKGNYNSINNTFELSVYSKNINYSGILFNNIAIDGKTENNSINMDINCSDIFIAQGIIVNNFKIKSNLKNDSLLFNVTWDNNNYIDRNSGNIVGNISFIDKSIIKTNFANSFFIVQDSIWEISSNNIVIDTSSISINNLAIKNGKQQININGKISENSKEKLNITFNEFDISNLDSLFAKMGFQADGIIKGTVDIVDIYKVINFYSDIRIENFAFNGENLGTMVLKSSWDNIKQAVLIDANIIYKGNIGENIPLAINGYFYPTAKDNNFDLNIDINNFKLNLIERYLVGIFSDIRGKASGKLRIEGKTDKPEIKGYLSLYHTGIHLDYLGTDYSLMGKIFVSPDALVFDSVLVYDNNSINYYKGSAATCKGKITHKNFKDFYFDISINPQRFTILNTNSSDNNIFYGQGFATGNVNIKGDSKNIFMDIYAITEKGTRIVLPFTGTSEVSENNFIYFTKFDSTESQVTEKLFENESGMDFKINIEITPDAEVKIEFDPKIGDVITARGKGNLLINASTNGDFNMFGEYIINEGNYLFTFENVINKQFKIASGGYISWNGDPYSAKTSLRAIYDKPRAPLYDLVMNIDSSSKYKQKIPVNCILGLSGNLFNPDISFGIDLPNADESTKEILYSVLDTTDKQEMLRQVFSLLVLNRFLPKQNTYENPLGVGVGNTSFEMLSSQLSNWLSQISNNFDVGFTYRPGDELSSDQVELALKTQFLQDRLIIDGNLDVAGNNPNSNSRASNIVGDVIVEYKLTEDGRFRVKAFNKSNTVELLDNNAPYIQGVGVFYRKEFDSFNDILKFKKNKGKNK